MGRTDGNIRVYWTMISSWTVGYVCLYGPIYFPFQPVVHDWFIKGRGMYCSVYGKVHIKDPLLLIEKSSLCGGSGVPSKKCQRDHMNDVQ